MQIYGSILAGSLVLSIGLSFLLAPKHKNALVSLWIKVVVLGFVFSRLVFVLSNFSYYTTEIHYPLAMLYFWEGGFSLFGAVIGALIAIWWFKKDNTSETVIVCVDACATTFWLFLLGLRFAESFAVLGRDETRLGVGKLVDVASTNVFVIGNEFFKTLAIYRIEATFALLALLTVALYYYYNKSNTFPFTTFFSLSLLSASQIVFESLRNDGHMLIGFVHVQQILFAFLLVFIIFYLHHKLKNHKRTPLALLITAVSLLVLVAFAMEFVVDGRLNLPLQLGNAFVRNYIIISSVSIFLFLLCVFQLKKLKNYN